MPNINDITYASELDSTSYILGVKASAVARFAASLFDTAVWHADTINPNDSLGKNGDFYINSSTGDIYLKESGTWGSAIMNIKGADGADGQGVPTGGSAGQYLKKNSSTDYDTVWGDVASAFTSLTDVPSSYTGHAGKVAQVKEDETGLEFVTPSSSVETAYNLGSSVSGSVTVDLSLGTSFYGTQTGSIAWTFSNCPSACHTFYLYLTNGGAYSQSFQSSVYTYDGLPPTLSTSQVSVLIFTTIDNGTIWYCTVLGTKFMAPVPTLPTSGMTMHVNAHSITGLSDGDSVSSWSDISGVGVGFYQGTSGYQPLYKTDIKNGKAALLFDGSDDFMYNTSSISVQTVVVVAKWATTGFNNYNGLFSCYSDYLIWLSANGSTDWDSGGVCGSNIYKDGVQTRNAGCGSWHIYIGIAGSLNTNQMEISRDRNMGGRSWNGYIASVVTYNRAIDATELTTIVNYYKWYYDIA